MVLSEMAEHYSVLPLCSVGWTRAVQILGFKLRQFRRVFTVRSVSNLLHLPTKVLGEELSSLLGMYSFVEVYGDLRTEVVQNQ